MFGPPPGGLPPQRPLGAPGGPPFGAPPSAAGNAAPPTAAFQQMKLGPPGQAPGAPPPGGPAAPPGAFGQQAPFGARNPPAGPLGGPPRPLTSPPAPTPNSAPGPFARPAPPPQAAGAGPASAGAAAFPHGPPPPGMFGAPRSGMPPPAANGPPAPGVLPPPPPGIAPPPPPGGFNPPPGAAPPAPGPGGFPPPFTAPGAPGGFPPPPPFGGAPPPAANGGPPPGPPGLPGPPPTFPPPPGAFPRPGAPSQPGYFPPPGSAASRPMPPSFGTMPPPGARGPTPPAPAAPPSRATNQSRIDPSQIPRPTARPTEATVFETRLNGAHNFPLPPATSQFVVKDMGNASPRLIRASLNSVPHTRDLCNSSAMPFVVVLSPMALPDPSDDPIQIVDNGEYGPVRCSRCKAYMNPFMKWVSGARSFVCNMCGHTNQCPDFFFCHATGDGRRRDADERPELCKGTVEYVATGDYYLRPPMPPVHFFLVDVSQPAISSGATAACCTAIEQVLDSIQGQDRAQVGLATFDSSIQFYSLSSTGQPQMLVVTDIDDAFAPASFPLLAPLAECRATLETLLNSIPQWFSQHFGAETATLSAIQAAMDAIGNTGGKLHVFATSLARIGAHKLSVREQNLVGDRAEKEKLNSLLTQDNNIKQVAVAAAERQVCIDLFFLNQQYVDVASMAELVTVTGGSLYCYQPWNSLLDTDQLLNDLRWNVVRPQALEAVMRVRSSAGLDVETYSGSFYKPTTADLIFPALDSDKAIVCKLSHQERLSLGECYIQSALLYTSTQGERRIRVSTIALPITDNISTIFKGADLDAQVTYLTRRVSGQLPGNSLGSCRELINNYAVNVLHAYRKYCATSSSAVQLILPEALKLLPLYTLSLLKSVGLQLDSKPDGRSIWITKMQSAACKEVLPRLHPRLIPLHTLVEPPADGQEPQIVIPLSLPLSAEHLKSGGVYLLEDGDSFLVLVDKATSPQLAHELLGDSLDAMQPGAGPIGLPVLDTPFNRAVQAVISQIRLQRCSYMRLRVVKRGDPLEMLFYSRLLEDKTASGMSYVDSLCHVHRLIQNKMS